MVTDKGNMHAKGNQKQNKSTLIMYLVTTDTNYRILSMKNWQI